MYTHIGERCDISDFESEEYLHINSCGIQNSMKKGYSLLRKKGRSDYHILYLNEGECCAEYENQSYVLHEGDFMFYPPHVNQIYRFNEGIHAQTYWIHFSGSAVPEIITESGLSGGFHHAVDCAGLKKYFEKLPLENVRNTLWEKTYFFGFLSSLCDSSAVNPSFPKPIKTALSYINNNLQKKLTVTELAAYAGLSESRFSHLFTEFVGISVKRYIENLKIQNIKELLINTDMSISAAAEYAGYGDSFYFSRVFKKYTGLSPSQYRKKQIFLPK